MTFTFWGLTGTFGFGLPLRWLGFILLAFDLLVFAWIVIDHRRRDGGRILLGWPLPSALAIAGIAAQAILVVNFKGHAGLATPGLPLQPTGQVGFIAGSVPLVLASGWFGIATAAAVGLISGVVRGGWYTHSLLTPFSLALTAGAVAWILRRPYNDSVGAAARRPLVAAMTGGLIYGFARCLELFVYSGGSTLDGLEYVVAQAGPVFQAALFEAVIAGLVGEAALFAAPARWSRPARLIPAPYLRSLGTRMVAFFLMVGLIAAMVLLVGDWALARTSARELIESQMEQTAIQAGGGVPFFAQSGRSFLQQAASRLKPSGGQVETSDQGLSQLLETFPFFQHAAFYDEAGAPRGSASLGSEGPPAISLEAEAALAAALAGVPQEVSEADALDPSQVTTLFLVPVRSKNRDRVVGALAGWTELASNPLLQPVASLIATFPEGAAMLIDEDGTILLHSDSFQVGASTALAGSLAGETFALTAPDGTGQLAYVYPVPGYDWTVILTVPQAAVDRLAIPIAARLFAVMAVAALVVASLTYTVSRRLTRPLRQMTLAAEAIAHGNLERPVPAAGDDEVGRLASALERMRRSLKIRLDEMDLLLQATQRMAASFDLGQVLPPILMGVQDVTESDLVRVTLAPAQTDSASLETHQSGADPGGWTSLDAQLLELCRERGRFLLENPARARALLDLRMLTEPLEGLLALPMRNEDEFVGALWIGYRRPHLFTSDETNLLTILAGQLGVSVANARLYQRAEQERLRLAATLEATPDAVLLLTRRDLALASGREGGG
jgi:GAF domain-containing protein